MNKLFTLSVLIILVTSCQTKTTKKNSTNEVVKEIEKNKIELPNTVKIEGVAQNPEGIEYNTNDQTFFLSSLNANPIIKINTDGTYKSFTSGEQYPVSTAGLQIDYKNNRLLVAGFNGMELYDNNPATKGLATLRIYNLETGIMEKDINLSSLVPDAPAYFANDVALDNEGNVYITDWYAGVVYKVDMSGKASILWENKTGIPSGTNGIDFHSDGHLLVSLVSVNEKGLYANYGLVKIPLNNPKSAKLVNITNSGFTGFDGMVIKNNGNVVGITNNGKTPGGNTLIELSSNNKWESAEVVNSKNITASTTVAVTLENFNYIINQDFISNNAENWTIERIKF